MADHPRDEPVEIDRPDVLDAVGRAFADYEAALVAHDLRALDGAFWDDPRVVRYGVADDQEGAAAVAAWRRESGPVTAGRVLHDTRVTTFGDSLAIVWTHFSDDAGGVGRQSQVWVRLEGRWRVVAAHVSRVERESASD